MNPLTSANTGNVLMYVKEMLKGESINISKHWECGMLRYVKICLGNVLNSMVNPLTSANTGNVLRYVKEMSKGESINISKHWECVKEMSKGESINISKHW